jgi:hypothetical protein
MRRAFIWFYLSCKRYLKRLPFLLVLLLLPFGAMLLKRAEKTGDQKIRIAVCAQDEEGSLGERLAQALAARQGEEDMFSFYLCESEEHVKEEVASRRAECGYVIYVGFEEKMASGKWKRSIAVYSAPSTVAAAISTETVFAELTKLYDRELLKNYLGSGEIFEKLGENGNTVGEELYEKWEKSGETFHFVYRYGDTETSADEAPIPTSDSSFAKTGVSVRGLAAVELFLAGLYGAVLLGEDERRGLFLPLPYALRIPCRLAVLAAPVVLSGCSCLAALFAGGEAENLGKEVLALLVYGITVLAAAWIIKLLCRTPQVLGCTIPFFLTGSLVFCPVFLDSGRLFPIFDLIGRCFLPYYYLKLW